jgi:hypothetical protein
VRSKFGEKGIWGHFAWRFLCQFSPNSETLLGELRRGVDIRPPYSTYIVPANVFLFRIKGNVKVKFQDIVGRKKNVTSELNQVPLDVLDDL